VTKTSKPWASAAAGSPPLPSVSQPFWAAVRTAWWGRFLANGAVCSDPARRVSALGRGQIEAASRKLDYGPKLLSIQAFVPVHEVVDAGASFEGLKHGCNRHPGAAQHPCAADLARNSFDRRALGPIENRHDVFSDQLTPDAEGERHLGAGRVLQPSSTAGPVSRLSREISACSEPCA